MYNDDYVETYDLLMRSRGKAYRTQALGVVREIRERLPEAASLLDLGTGTGLHAQFFAEEFDDLVGADISADMMALAAKRVPGMATLRVDARAEIDLGRTFDAISCLWVIPHLESADEFEALIAGLLKHLNPGGVLVIEPWYGPDEFHDGYVAGDRMSKENGGAIVRLSHARRIGAARIEMVVHHAVADPGEGLREFTEQVRLSLFTREQLAACFASAGAVAEHVERDSFAWGLWVARAAA
ncbi:class I SAM-dependent DNA methyltransferase [Lentzea flava]|uniref:Methyltransferase domain-containing protein n=1 Tax=Lentzea flava TaxID=103732 RepID=A0ABQ2V7R6_9PSEU|nr:class I SAM-dependent methyltransferase [Lentzea flava]MCP2203826.1 Methyltransferase domain-containing protein [Lentzea flava]GGU72014.1 hypothetical protein GCM10010178_74600 [Lentzea flava]